MVASIYAAATGETHLHEGDGSKVGDRSYGTSIGTSALLELFCRVSGLARRPRLEKGGITHGLIISSCEKIMGYSGR